METIICKKCGIEKKNSEFYKSKRIKNGYSTMCNECRKEYYNKYKQNNPDKIKEYTKRTYEKHKEKRLKQIEEYRLKNIDKVKERNKNWKNKNKERIKIARNKRNKERRRTDEIYRLTTNIGNRMRLHLKKDNKNERTIKYIGCTPTELKCHLENQFTEGMSWENYGKYGWHIDHIIPLFTGKDNKEEIIKLCHYTNLQPLWCEDNYKKSKNI